MEQLFMGVVSLYFLIKGIYIEEFDWITGPEDE